MRILHTSDWHLGRHLYDFSLLDDQRRVIDFFIALIKEKKIDIVIIAGDIYDRPVPSAEAVRLYDYFLTNTAGGGDVSVVAVAGNHDSASRLEFGGSLYARSGYYVFGSPGQNPSPVTFFDDYGDLRVYPVPWLHPAQIRVLFEDESVKTFDDAYRVYLSKISESLDKTKRNIAVAHGFFSRLSENSEKPFITSDSEVSIGGGDIVDSSYFDGFDYVALGHLHAPQRAGSEFYRYSGSPLKYSLSEENQRKACTIIEFFDKGSLKAEQIDIPAHLDVRSVTGEFAQLIEPSFHSNKNFNDYVFANITDSGALYPMEKLRTLFPRLLGLKFTRENALKGDLDLISKNKTRLTTGELFDNFYRFLTGENMSDEKSEFLRAIIEKSEAIEE